MQLPPAPPELPSPRKKLPNVRLVIPVLAIVLIVAVLAGALQMVRGAANSKHAASGLVAAATTTTATSMGTTTTTATGTATPGPTPLSTATSKTTTWTANVRVTQNQDMRPACIDDPKPYTVVLYNAGNVTANWHVYIPPVTGSGAALFNPAARQQPLSSPLGTVLYWANVSPQNGSIAPGKTASFVMTPVAVPCGGTTYHASVQLSFASGASQADIPLSYAGTGPARYSDVVLAAGSLNITQPCPASGTAPAPFTFAIKNTGNYKAYAAFDYAKDTIGLNPWATITSVTISPPEPDTHWLYPGETWTVTVAPRSGVRCDGTVYHVYTYITNAQGTTPTMTFTDTFTVG